MMTKKCFGIAAAFLLALFGLAPAEAQRMAVGGLSRAPTPAVRVRPAGPAGVRASGPRAVTGTARVRSNGTFLGPGFAPGVGNGFGTGLYNGFGGNLSVEAAIDPATQWKLALAERLARLRGFGGSGSYLVNGGYVGYEDSETGEPASYAAEPGQPAVQSGQQPIIVIQQPASGMGSVEPAPIARQETPLPDVGQFTLVTRNGTRVPAIGFTRMGDRIIYITVEGSRRTMATADLDVDATRKLNEERGTPLTLPL
jgi:hypothetical protein